MYGSSLCIMKMILVFVEVSKGLPLSQDLENTLTEEEKQEIRSREGKWTAAAP